MGEGTEVVLAIDCKTLLFSIQYNIANSMFFSTLILWGALPSLILGGALPSLILCKATAFDMSMLSARYPVGYDPDNRVRPNYMPLCELGNTAFKHMPLCEQHACGLKQRPKWEPPVGYDPRKRKLALRSPTTELELETIHFENDYDSDTKLKLCTGIWMGNKILEKRCVWLDYEK